jgi:putative phosphoribosyl transferase
MMPPPFEDRVEAGAFLATKLIHYAHRPDVIILGLPRGGVPVAYVIAQALGVPLDVFIVRKLGVPGHEELAMGALAMGGVRLLNRAIAAEMQVSQTQIEAVVKHEAQELIRREHLYRGNRPALDVHDQTVILVDDGLATGASMWAAVVALRKLHPARIVVAVPVASDSTCNILQPEVDEIVCGITPNPFISVGSWYINFPQTTDDEVIELLDRAPQPLASGTIKEPAS